MGQDGKIKALLRAGQHRESKAGRFTRLAERRVTDTINRLRLVGNLANRNNYEYTKEQADQIVTALEAAMRQVRARFSEDAPVRTNGFRFKR